MDVVRGELLLCGVAKEGLEAGVELADDFVVDAGRVVRDLIVGRDAHLILRADGDDADGSAFELRFEGRTHLVGANILIETDHIVATAGKVDAVVEADRSHRNTTEKDDGERDDVAHFTLTEEVDLRIVEEVLRDRCGEGQVLDLLLSQEGFVDETCDEDRGQEG